MFSLKSVSSNSTPIATSLLCLSLHLFVFVFMSGRLNWLCLPLSTASYNFQHAQHSLWCVSILGKYPVYEGMPGHIFKLAPGPPGLSKNYFYLANCHLKMKYNVVQFFGTFLTVRFLNVRTCLNHDYVISVQVYFQDYLICKRQARDL